MFDRTNATTLLVELTDTHARVWSGDDKLYYNITFFGRIMRNASFFRHTPTNISFELRKETPRYWKNVGRVDMPPV